MKPVQVTIQKPEEQDWVRDDEFKFWTWKNYTIIDMGLRLDCYCHTIGLICSRIELEEAQEACWQHYLKTIGADE